MQNFPSLQEQQYVKTRRRIHSIARLLGRLREVLVEPLAKNDNLWLSVVDKGFCTPPMTAYNELEIGFNAELPVIEIADSQNRYASVNVLNKSMQTLAGETLNILNSDFGVSPALSADEFDPQTVINIKHTDALDFLAQLVSFAGCLKSFHGSLGLNDGIKTGIYLWPHHFDNAFKWFSGRKINESDEQMGIGVSNGDEMYELPYVYITLSPELRKTNTLDIPEGAMLHDSNWQGFILPYESILEKDTAEKQAALVKDFFESGFTAVKRGFSKR